MKKTRTKHTPAFEAKVALEAVREDLTEEQRAALSIAMFQDCARARLSP